MTTQTLGAIEFRCKRCWNSNFAPVEISGQTMPCQVCQAEVMVPEATPERLRPAEMLEKASAASLADPRQNMSDAELMRLVQRENSVSLGERQFAGLPDASRFMRLVASFVDGLCMIVAGAVGLAATITASNAGYFELLESGSKELSLPALIVFGFFPLVLAIVQWNLITTRGQTLGKMLTGIRIVTVDGRLPGFLLGVVARNWLRMLLSLVPFFGMLDILVIFGSSSRCIHDFLAGTRVVEAF